MAKIQLSCTIVTQHTDTFIVAVLTCISRCIAHQSVRWCLSGYCAWLSKVTRKKSIPSAEQASCAGVLGATVVAFIFGFTFGGLLIPMAYGRMAAIVRQAYLAGNIVVSSPRNNYCFTK